MWWHCQWQLAKLGQDHEVRQIGIIGQELKDINVPILQTVHSMRDEQLT